MTELTGHLKLEEQVTWTGMLEGDLKWGAFRAAEAFILPSHQENFGVSVVEALACGVPVLISDQVNIWREIASARAGLVESDDLDGTIRLLERWLELSEAERQSMGIESLRCFKKEFEVMAVAHHLITIINTASY